MIDDILVSPHGFLPNSGKILPGLSHVKGQNPMVMVTRIASINGMMTRNIPTFCARIQTNNFSEPVGDLAETTSRVRGLCAGVGERGEHSAMSGDGGWFSSLKRRF